MKENKAMWSRRTPRLAGSVAACVLLFKMVGCYHTPVDTSEYAQGPAPLRMPSPAREAQAHRSYEDSLTGGQVFTMYCNSCHNSPTLAERPFSNFQNVATHMRVRANLTGKEYARLMEFLRRWNDIPPPSPPPEPSAKRFIFPQQIPELRPQTQKGAPQGGAQAAPEEAAGVPQAGQTAALRGLEGAR
jgi:hypothetical protein